MYLSMRLGQLHKNSNRFFIFNALMCVYIYIKINSFAHLGEGVISMSMGLVIEIYLIPPAWFSAVILLHQFSLVSSEADGGPSDV